MELGGWRLEAGEKLVYTHLTLRFAGSVCLT